MGKEPPKQVSVHPIKILPQEVWAAIFERIDDPIDLRNCYNVHPAWRHILSHPNFHFRLTFHLILKYLETTDIVRARLVSKHAKKRLREFGVVGISQAHITTTSNAGIERVEKFCREMQNCPENPIVSRSVQLHSFPPDPVKTRFLECFGIYIWHLTLFFPVNTSGSRLLQLLGSLLENVPNLKILRIEFLPYHTQPKYRGGKNIRENILPSLKNLSTLEIALGEGADMDIRVSQVTQQLGQSYGPQLKRLFHIVAMATNPSIFQNLNYLSLLISKPAEFTIFDSIRCPIKALELHVTMSSGVHLFNIFEAAENFKLTLTSLSFFLYYEDDSEEKQFLKWKAKDIDLPRLERLLCSNIGGKCVNFNFLEELPSLRRLDILMAVGEDYERKERVKISKYLRGRDIYESNVWKVLPRLEKVVIWQHGSRFDCYYPVGEKVLGIGAFTRSRYKYCRRQRNRSHNAGCCNVV